MAVINLDVTRSVWLPISVHLLTVLMLLHIPEFADGQSGLELFATPNPLYSYESLTLDCTFGSNQLLLSAEITVFQGQQLMGYLLYTCTGNGTSSSTGTGVLSSTGTVGCNVLGSTSFSVYLYSTMTQNFYVNCSATLMDSGTLGRVRLSSAFSSVVVLVLPGAPQFSPSPPIFNNGLNATLSCTSYGGIPAASLLLEIKSSQTSKVLHTSSGTSVTSASWTMSTSYQNAVATCRITNHLRNTYPTTAYIWPYGYTELTFNRNPVYENEIIVFTCSFSKECLRYDTRCVIKISAFNGTEVKGVFTSEYYSGFYNGTGIFVYVYPSYDWSLQIVKVSITASRLMELDYSCASYNYYSAAQVLGSTLASRLAVLIAPSSPELLPRFLAFIDSIDVRITCRTYSSGKPAAILQLLVNSTQLSQTQRVQTGTGFASIRLTISRVWHGANVSCSVLNHNRSNLIVGGNIQVFHLAAKGTPDVIYTCNNDSILDCATYVEGYPEPTFRWSVPMQLNTSDVKALNERYFLIGKNQSGSFNCTATNPITAKNVTVTFLVNDAPTEKCVPSQAAMIAGVAVSMTAVALCASLAAIIIHKRRKNINSGTLKCWYISKQPESPANPGNVYVKTTSSGLPTVTENAVEPCQSLQQPYGTLNENGEDAGSAYSKLENTYQNSA